jgi:Actin like proteins N terminal domain
MARPRLNFQIGLDLGNGNIKVATDDYSDRIPSYIDNCKGSDAVGSVLIKGDKDISFCVGYGASKSKTGIPTSSDKSIKIDGINKLYLGTLAHLPTISKVMHCQIIVSSHAWESHKDIIKANLSQELDVKLAGTDVKLTTEVLAVVPEGFGAIAFMPDKKIATLDFGTGTVLLTPYSNRKPQETRTSIEGVQKLINMICDNMKAINNGYVGDSNEVRRCLEQGNFKTVDGCDFKKVYQSCLGQWWNTYLKDLGSEAASLKEDGYKILCIGGGVALPGFSKVLAGKGFEIISERPEMASVTGLYQLAMKKVGATNA